MIRIRNNYNIPSWGIKIHSKIEILSVCYWIVYKIFLMLILPLFISVVEGELVALAGKNSFIVIIIYSSYWEYNMILKTQPAIPITIGRV